MRRLLLIGLLMSLSACQYIIDGGRPNIIPLPDSSDRLGDRPNTADDNLERKERFQEPWASMNLPYGDAEIQTEEANKLVLQYDNNKLEGTTTSYDSYFRTGGWRPIYEAMESNTRTRHYQNEGLEIHMLVEYAAEPTPSVTVTMEQFSASAE
ncbi:MAG: hypothetical protein AAFV53_05380 [Myxococcota bacterium]